MPSPDDPQKILTKPCLPKRFYREAAVQAKDSGFALTLDGKVAKTPGKRPMLLPTGPAAALVAAEFAAQAEVIDPVSMPVMRLCNSVIDGVAGQESAVAEDAARYAASDLLCYRGTSPDALIARQNAAWDPVLQGYVVRHGLTFKSTPGIVFVEQQPASLAGIRRLTGTLNAFELACVHQMTTLMGSVLLALAVAEGAIVPESAWNAAHVDEDWEISQWGEDDEAIARRRHRTFEFMASVALLTAVR